MSTTFTRGENPLRADKLNTAFSERVSRSGDSMQGMLTLLQDPVNTFDAATKQYVDTKFSAGPSGGPFLALSGGTMTGTLTLGPSLLSAAAKPMSLGTTSSGEVLRINDPGGAQTSRLDITFTIPINTWTLGIAGSASNLMLASSGGGNVILRANNGSQFGTGAVSASVNYLQASGSTGTSPVILSATGTSANLDISLTPKGTGGVRVNGPIGFNSTAPITKPTVSGAKGSNAALASLLTALAAYGLVTDTTTA